MSVTVERTHQIALHWIHPVHAVLLAGTVPQFLGAMLSDIAYSASYEVQWINFASWLIVGGLVFGGFALLAALIDLFRANNHGNSHGNSHGNRHGRRPLVYALLLLATWILGFINALMHAKDAAASMPTGLSLSVIVLALACAATWVGFSSLRVGGAK